MAHHYHYFSFLWAGRYTLFSLARLESRGKEASYPARKSMEEAACPASRTGPQNQFLYSFTHLLASISITTRNHEDHLNLTKAQGQDATHHYGRTTTTRSSMVLMVAQQEQCQVLSLSAKSILKGPQWTQTREQIAGTWGTPEQESLEDYNRKFFSIRFQYKVNTISREDA